MDRVKLVATLSAGFLALATSGVAAALPARPQSLGARPVKATRSRHDTLNARHQGSAVVTTASFLPASIFGQLASPWWIASWLSQVQAYEQHVQAAQSPQPVATSSTQSTPEGSTPDGSAPGGSAGEGCQAAVAYLATHAAPGFTFVCPGYAFGRQAMTCVNDPPYCGDGQKLIVISDPCPAAYMNEASNSLVFSGLSDAPIDPYGACSS